ncbi:hypothetical protein ACFY36_36105 [Actinoplanes sp. NPDC000266]
MERTVGQKVLRQLLESLDDAISNEQPLRAIEMLDLIEKLAGPGYRRWLLQVDLHTAIKTAGMFPDRDKYPYPYVK